MTLKTSPYKVFTVENPTIKIACGCFNQVNAQNVTTDLS